MACTFDPFSSNQIWIWNLRKVHSKGRSAESFTISAEDEIGMPSQNQDFPPATSHVGEPVNNDAVLYHIFTVQSTHRRNVCCRFSFESHHLLKYVASLTWSQAYLVSTGRYKRGIVYERSILSRLSWCLTCGRWPAADKIERQVVTHQNLELGVQNPKVLKYALRLDHPPSCRLELPSKYSLCTSRPGLLQLERVFDQPRDEPQGLKFGLRCLASSDLEQWKTKRG